MLNKQTYENVRTWIYRNARPIDLARWQYHFENGSIEPVLATLAAYQNEDGGFGHALEADCWNPNSTPIQTWVATEILREVGFTDKEHPVIKGILRYLDSGADFNGRVWANTVLSNNDYPHAPWWNVAGGHTNNTDYNPTACLVGFGLYFAEKDSSLYRTCQKVAIEAVERYLTGCYLKDMHTGACYVRLMEYCNRAGITSLFDIAAFKAMLAKQVKRSITADTSLWKTKYVCKPSQYFDSPDSIFYQDNKAIADYECEFISNTCDADGCWNIIWKWDAYPNEWAVSKNWWKGNLIILNMLYLRNFGELSEVQTKIFTKESR